MNIFTKRRGRPLPLMRARSVEGQAAQRKRDDAWTAKMDRQLDDELRHRADSMRPKIPSTSQDTDS